MGFDIFLKIFVKVHSYETKSFVKKHKNPHPRANQPFRVIEAVLIPYWTVVLKCRIGEWQQLNKRLENSTTAFEIQIYKNIHSVKRFWRFSAFTAFFKIAPLAVALHTLHNIFAAVPDNTKFPPRNAKTWNSFPGCLGRMSIMLSKVCSHGRKCCVKSNSPGDSLVCQIPTPCPTPFVHGHNSDRCIKENKFLNLFWWRDNSKYMTYLIIP